MYNRVLFRYFLILLTFSLLSSSAHAQWLDTPAERSEYRNGGTLYEPLMDFLYELESQSPLMNVQKITETLMGRDVVLCILSDPPIFKPEDVTKTGKPVVLIVNNVHGGEVAGKDASMEIIRDLALGDLQPLLKDVVVLNVPTINPDGAELRRRTNERRFDMNRDYLKLESQEIHALVTEVINKWHPDIHIDTHHGGSAPYTLTYQTCMNPAGDAGLMRYGNEDIIPRIKSALRAEDYDGFWYTGPGTVDGVEGWVPTSVEPRKQHVYSTLANMIGFLFETPSNTYRVINEGSQVVSISAEERYEHQIRGQYIGQREIIRFASEHSDEIKYVIKQATIRAIELGNDDSDNDQIPVWYKQEAKFDEKFWRRTDWMNRPRESKNGVEFDYVSGPVFTKFTPIETVTRPWGYLMPPGLAHVIPLLLEHEITVKRLSEAVTLNVEVYYANKIVQTNYFQGHYLKQVAASVKSETVSFPAGTFFVPSGQPKSNLISYILEPETNDNLITWGYLDNFLQITSPDDQPDTANQNQGRQNSERNQQIPIYRLMKQSKLSGVLVQPYNDYQKNRYIK